MMNISRDMTDGAAGFELFFSSFFDGRPGFAFPCDRSGTVNIDDLTERQRLNYLYARSLIGRDFASPSVQPRQVH
jgi:hypothetical protein